jgi:FkbM family methyltransferase
MLSRVWKPWYVWRPHQLLRRMLQAVRPAPEGIQPLAVAWGATVLADPSKHVGMSIHTTGIYDLAVSEVLIRLVDAGDTVVDAGANVGYMTVLGARLAGPSGQVHAFEPHPALFEVLTRNAGEAQRAGQASPVSLHDAALGARTGRAELVVPDGFEHNDGLARIRGVEGGSEPSIDVRMTTIDEALGTTPIGVLKLDVEGLEHEVLTGASGALRAQSIRHVVFEDHDGPGSAVMTLLESAGYRLYAIGWSVGGLRIGDVRGVRLASVYEAPSYLATRDPAEVERRCSARGWRALRRL